MRRLSVLLVVLGVFAFAGCATQPQVETDHQANFDFSSLKTFDVAETKQDSKESILVSPFTLSHIHSVLEAELGKRYQSAATGAKPDFIVSYHVVIEEKIDPRSYNDLYGFGYYGRGYRYPYAYPYFYGPGAGVRVYNQGSLIVDVVDAKTDKPIWRGVSEKRLSRSMAPQQQREVLTGAVAEVVAKFPPVN